MYQAQTQEVLGLSPEEKVEVYLFHHRMEFDHTDYYVLPSKKMVLIRGDDRIMVIPIEIELDDKDEVYAEDLHAYSCQYIRDHGHDWRYNHTLYGMLCPCSAMPRRTRRFAFFY